jgi:hypothetical protein
MKNINNTIDDCGKIKNNIMEKVTSVLLENNIKYSINNKDNTEIYIPKGKRDKIVKILHKIDIEEDTLKMLLSVNETSTGVFIRQKVN